MEIKSLFCLDRTDKFYYTNGIGHGPGNQHHDGGHGAHNAGLGGGAVRYGTRAKRLRMFVICFFVTERLILNK